MRVRHYIFVGIILFLIVLVLLLAPWRRSILLPALACTGSTQQQQYMPPSQALSGSPPPSFIGLDAYRHWDKLSYVELGDRVQGQSTADIFAGNHDNTHFLRALPNGGHVLFDQVGPGLVTFMRMQENYGAPWQLALDDQPQRTISPNDLGQQTNNNPAAQIFPYPLSLNQQESQGSSIIAASLPFQQHMQWSSRQANGNFYSLYRKFPYHTTLPAWNTATSNDVAQLLRQSAANSLPTTLSCQHGTLDAQARTTTPLTTVSGPAQIRAITFRVPMSEIASFGNARLQIAWDGERDPSVDVPLKFLVGAGAGVYQPASRPLVAGWIANTTGDGQTFMDFNLFWPMPFSTRAQMALQTDTSPLSAIKWSVKYEPFPDPPDWWGTFHATYNSVPRPASGQDMTFLDARGSGKIVGTVINFTATDGTLEGNPSFYLDDSRTPQIEVTGTEEWGLGGNYWNGGHQTSLPLGGLPSSSNNPPGSDHDGAALYRFLIADSIPFNSHAIVRWQHGGTDEGIHPYRAAIFWYGTPTQTATLSDALQPTAPTNRLTHNYHAPGEQSYTLNAADPYQIHSTATTATGTASTGTTTFTMTVNPHNVGAFLRRTFDYCVPNQRASITIDGHDAGIWYDAGDAGSATTSNQTGSQHCWREEDFPLPAALTAGKSAITVSVTFLPTADPPDRSWTAFRYQLYSFILPYT